MHAGPLWSHESSGPQGDLANLEAMESHSDGFMAVAIFGVEMWISCIWICENGRFDSISKDMYGFIHN